MLRLLLPAAAVAVALSLTPAQATVVSVGFAGTVIGGSGDFNGLFGTSGPIAGNAITGTFSYDNANFNAPSAACTVGCAFWNSADGSMQNGTVTITETINGVTLAWRGVYYSDLALANSTTAGAWEYGAGSGGAVQLFDMESCNIPPPNVLPGYVCTKLVYGMYDHSATIVNSALDPAGMFDLQAAQFQSLGSSWSTPNAYVQWTFQTNSVDVPEPASLAVFVVGLMGLAGLRRRSGGISGASE
jgi:hypothetical protein